MKRRTLIQAALAVTLAPALARAQAYPAKAIRIVNPFSAGGGLDQLARTPLEGIRAMVTGYEEVEDHGHASTDTAAKAP